MDRFLKQSEVLTAVGLSRQFVYKLRKDGSFPEPIILGVGALRWRESEIKAWVDGEPLA